MVSSVPLSERHVAGLPRCAMIASSSRATRPPESEVSATKPKHSRVQSSTTARLRNRRPSVKLFDTKSRLQRSLGRDGTTSGALMPKRACAPCAFLLSNPLAGTASGSSPRLPSLRENADADSRTDAAPRLVPECAGAPPHRRLGGCGSGSSTGPHQVRDMPAARSPRGAWHT